MSILKMEVRVGRKVFFISSFLPFIKGGGKARQGKARGGLFWFPLISRKVSVDD